MVRRHERDDCNNRHLRNPSGRVFPLGWYRVSDDVSHSPASSLARGQHVLRTVGVACPPRENFQPPVQRAMRLVVSPHSPWAVVRGLATTSAIALIGQVLAGTQALAPNHAFDRIARKRRFVARRPVKASVGRL